jgi:PAS domain S-box-containing protein
MSILPDINTLLFEQIPCGIAVLDINLNIVCLSNKWKEDFETAILEKTNVSFFDAYPAFRAPIESLLKKCLHDAKTTADKIVTYNHYDLNHKVNWQIKPSFQDEVISGLIISYEKSIDLTQDETYKLILEASKVTRVGGWIFDLEEQSLIWSDVTKEIHEVPQDYEPNVETGINFYLEGEDRDAISELFGAAVEKGKKFERDFRIVTAKGNIKWVRSKGIPKLKGKKVVQVSGTFQDIHRYKVVEQELSSSEAKFRNVFKHSPIGLVLNTIGEGWTDMNDSFCEMVGYTRKELEKLKFPDIILSDDTERYEELLQHLAEGEIEQTHSEMRFVHKKGRIIWAQINYSVIRDESDNPYQIIKQVNDITYKKLAEEKLVEERTLLRTIIDNIPINIYVKDLKSRKIIANKAEYLYMGASSEEEILFKEEGDLFPDKSATLSIAEDQEVINTGQAIINKETINYKKDGEERYFFVSKLPYIDIHGNIIGIIGISYDGTELKQKEEELSKEKALLRTIIDNIPVNVYMKDAKANKIMANKAEYEFLGLNSEAEMFNTSDDEIYTDLTHIKSYEEDMQVIEEGLTILNKEVHTIKKDGDIAFLYVSKIPFKNKQGKIIGLLGLSYDGTALKLKEIELQNIISVASEQNKRLLNFNHIVSHNLRSHSGNIFALLNLFADEDEKITKNPYFAAIQKASNNLNETIAHLNEIISITDKTELNNTPLNILDEVSKAVNLSNNELSEFNAKIDLEIDENLTVYATPAYLESILFNLINNALKYRHPDRDPVLVIKAYQDNENVIISVTDNGLGIDLAKHGERLFGMYNTFHRNKDAKGIGLYITKNQIETMGGSINVESTPEEGSTFKVSLPSIDPIS